MKPDQFLDAVWASSIYLNISKVLRLRHYGQIIFEARHLPPLARRLQRRARRCRGRKAPLNATLLASLNSTHQDPVLRPFEGVDVGFA